MRWRHLAEITWTGAGAFPMSPDYLLPRGGAGERGMGIQ